MLLISHGWFHPLSCLCDRSRLMVVINYFFPLVLKGLHGDWGVGRRDTSPILATLPPAPQLLSEAWSP